MWSKKNVLGENKSLDKARKKNLLIGLLIKPPLQIIYMWTIYNYELYMWIEIKTHMDIFPCHWPIHVIKMLYYM